MKFTINNKDMEMLSIIASAQTVSQSEINKQMNIKFRKKWSKGQISKRLSKLVKYKFIAFFRENRKKYYESLSAGELMVSIYHISK